MTSAALASDLERFLKAFKDRDGNYRYFDRINNMMASNAQSLVVDYIDFDSFNPVLAKQLTHAPDKMLEVGERIWNMERVFNMRAGFTAKDDTLPPRLLNEAAQTGPAKGLVNGLAKMLPEYYELRGWDTEGVPKADTLTRLGL